MRIFRYLAAAAILAAGLLCPRAEAAARRPKCSVRFYAEVSSYSENPFATPIKTFSPPRQVFIENSAFISERNITGVHVFPFQDGTWGCVFRLDSSGRIALATVTSANRGRSVFFYLGNEKTSRQVLEIFVDRPVNDGVLPVSRGLTYPEVQLLQKQFPPLKPEEAK